MFWCRKYLFALFPAAVTVGAWQLAVLAFNFFGCQGDIKHMKNCFSGSLDLLPFMEIGLFWMPITSLITVPISAIMLIFVGARHIGSRNGVSEN